MKNIIGDIKGNTYKKFMNYLYKRCDKITFFLTDYNERCYQKENIKGISENCQGDVYYALNGQETLQDYTASIEKRYPVILKHCNSKYFGFKYPSICTDVKMAIYEVNFNEEILDKLLLNQTNLYNFKYSKRLPEDLCFYEGDNLLITTIIHDDLCLINDESIIDDLIKKGIFQERNFSEI